MPQLEWDDLGLAGESMDNADGTSRQEEIARCAVDEFVLLQREPDNEYDPNAVLVLSERDIGIGYIPRQQAKRIAKLLDAGHDYDAFISEILGGTKAKPSRGVWITVTFEDAEEAEARRAKEQPAIRSKMAAKAAAKPIPTSSKVLLAILAVIVTIILLT